MRFPQLRRRAILGVAASLAALSMAACGGGSASKTAGSAPSSKQATAAQPATSSGTPQSTSGGTDLASKGCTALKLADLQAVVKTTVTKVDFTPGDAELDPNHSFRCDVNNPTLIIAIHPEDASKKTYDQDVAAENVPAVALPGVGDAAVWTAVSLTPGSYTAAPDVYAHKGAVTCEISGDGEHLTITKQPDVTSSIKQADAASFAGKLGVLCNDVFAAIA